MGVTISLRRLAQRAGYICSHPGCRQLTVGPSEDRVSSVTMVGVAAHITAASVKGPRYDAPLKSEERASNANGVWMGQVHGKMIDDNASRHTVAELQRWKTQHEEWVFRHVASADSVVQHGLTSISLRNVGPFREKTTVALGRHTVVLGPNGAGKSSLGEAITAFAGSQNFDAFSERWSLFGPRSPDMAISASISVDGARRTVRLSEEKTGLRPSLVRRQARLHIEVDGGVTIRWPRSLFNVVLLEKQDRKPTVSDPFRRDLRFIGGQLGLGQDHIWDGLREQLFAGAPFGSRIRQVGE